MNTPTQLLKCASKWELDRYLSRAEYDYLIDLFTSVITQIATIKKRVDLMECDMKVKLDALRKLPHD